MARSNRSLSMGFTDVEPKTPTNTPTNEGTNETTNTPSNESTNPETSVPTNQPTNPPTNPGTIEGANQPAPRANVRTYQPTEPRKRYSFDLRPSVHKALKTECVLDDLNMYEVVENLILQWVEERRRERGQ